RREVDSHIINRALLDQRLAERAASAGAELTLEAKAYDAQRHPDGYLNLRARVRGETKEFRARLVIDAEGAKPTLLEAFGLTATDKPLVGLQYEMSNVSPHALDCVELYFGRQLAPGFFAWIVPTGEDRARVGLCARAEPPGASLHWLLRRFVERHPAASQKLKDGKVEAVSGGRNPAGPIGCSFADGLMVIGDSAGHVKATSGGGVYFALRAGELAGRTAIEALNAGRFDRGFLRRYETGWRSLIGAELRFTYLARKVLNRLSDGDLDRIFQLIAEEEGTVEAIERYGDTAFQSRVLRPLLSRLTKASMRGASDLLFLSTVLGKAILASLT
ncbi:MAG: NAD(P)/FAD-dependent oxidoreductase, partial [Candidatus Bathyarchaeia archaeon]